MKIGFFWTPSLAAAVLSDCLAASDIEVAYVVSQPDKPVWRHAVLTPSPVSELALHEQIPLFRPEKIRNNQEFISDLQKFEVDFLVVVAYGKILPTEILNLPKHIPVNVHGSILPKYRGASPIQSALLNWEKETWVTIMTMSSGMDEGDVLSITTIAISPDETSGTLFQKFSNISWSVLCATLRDYLSGRILPTPQNHETATYTKKFDKEDGRIRFKSVSAIEAYRQWQACTPWPSAWAMVSGKRCKIVKCSLVPPNWSMHTLWLDDSCPGRIYCRESVCYVSAREGFLVLDSVVLEWKKESEAVQALASFAEFDE